LFSQYLMIITVIDGIIQKAIFCRFRKYLIVAKLRYKRAKRNWGMYGVFGEKMEEPNE